MFCPSCGVADAHGRFCSECGNAVAPSTATPPAPVIKNDVNVSVNVGNPMVVNAAPPRTVGQDLARGAVNAVQAARQARRAALAQRVEAEKLHASTVGALDTCHVLIAEIEGTIGLELLPSETGARARYVQALESRRRAAEMLAGPIAESQLRHASELVLHSVRELRAIKDEIRLALP